MASDSENSYGSILKRISVFGGVQVFNILLSLVRGKFVAMFLGTAGMGVNSLYVSATTAVQQIGGLGLNSAFVKEVSGARQDAVAERRVMGVVRRLNMAVACLGAVLCFALAPLLSRWSFGSGDYTIGFMFLSIFVALSIGGSGYLSILQGVGAVKSLAHASVVGGLTGLLVGVPLYYYIGTRGIVPALIAMSLATFLFYYISCRRHVLVEPERFSWKAHRPLVMKILGLGVVFMAGGVFSTVVGYIINAFVRHVGSIEDVGLYQAANSMTNQYSGLLFTALAMDYFPRLSAASAHNRRMVALVNRQVEVVSLIGTPLVLLLIISAPLLIRVLLTSEFLPVVSLMRWMGLGILLQLLCYPLGYMYVAKGNRRVFFRIEAVWSNVIWLVCSVAGFYWMGLVGLGVSLVVRNVIFIVIDYIVNSRMYGFRYSWRTIREMTISIVLGTGAFLASFISGWTAYAIMGLLAACSSVYSLTRLRRVMRKGRTR